MRKPQKSKQENLDEHSRISQKCTKKTSSFRYQDAHRKREGRTEKLRLSHVDSGGNGASEDGARGNWSVRGFLRRRRGAVITLLKSLNDELADRNLDSRLQHQ